LGETGLSSFADLGMMQSVAVEFGIWRVDGDQTRQVGGARPALAAAAIERQP